MTFQTTPPKPPIASDAATATGCAQSAGTKNDAADTVIAAVRVIPFPNRCDRRAAIIDPSTAPAASVVSSSPNCVLLKWRISFA